MPRPRQTQPTDAELRILEVFWQRGALAARDVSDALREKTGEEPKPTTLNSAIHTMVTRGYIRIVDDRKPYRYKAAITEADARKQAGGKVRSLIRSILGDRQPSADELQAIEDFLREQREKSK